MNDHNNGHTIRGVKLGLCTPDQLRRELEAQQEWGKHNPLTEAQFQRLDAIRHELETRMPR